MTNFDEISPDTRGLHDLVDKLEKENKALTDAISAVTAERDRLQAFCDEFVWGEDNPNEYQSKMSKLEAELAEAEQKLAERNETAIQLGKENSYATKRANELYAQLAEAEQDAETSQNHNASVIDRIVLQLREEGYSGTLSEMIDDVICSANEWR